MTKRLFVIASIALCAVAVVVLVIVKRDQNTSTQPVHSTIELGRAAPDSRGPRPTATRLRNGAQQIESSADALLAAEKSLVRVETEIAATSDIEKQRILERQKAMIQAVIVKLKK